MDFFLSSSVHVCEFSDRRMVELPKMLNIMAIKLKKKEEKKIERVVQHCDRFENFCSFSGFFLSNEKKRSLEYIALMDLDFCKNERFNI